MPGFEGNVDYTNAQHIAQLVPDLSNVLPQEIHYVGGVVAIQPEALTVLRTARRIRAVAFAGFGRENEEVAMAMERPGEPSLRPNTVTYELDKARRTLGAVRRYDLLPKALAQGLMKITVPGQSELFPPNEDALEVITRIAQGKSMKIIARELGVSVDQLGYRVGSVYPGLNQAALVAHAAVTQQIVF